MLISVDFPCKLSGKSKSVCTYKKYVDFLKIFNLYISPDLLTNFQMASVNCCSLFYGVEIDTNMETIA